MRKLGHREVKQLVQDHIAIRQLSYNLKPGCFVLGPRSFTGMPCQLNEIIHTAHKTMLGEHLALRDYLLLRLLRSQCLQDTKI